MRITLLCIVCLVTFGLLGGVALAGQGAAFGIKGGVNWATLSVKPDTVELDYAMRPGGGVCFSFALNPNVWLDIDALYLQKGAIETYDEALQINDTEWHLNYAVVSPMLRLALSGAGSGPYLLGGAEIGYLVDWEILHDDGIGGTESYSEDGVLEDLDYSVTVGAGLQLAGSGGAQFFLEGRYTIGLRDIVIPVTDGEADQNIEIKTQGIYALAGLRF